METIDYNGMVLEEFTSDKPVTFEPAKKMFVWNEGYLFDEKLVLYVNTRYRFVVSIDSDGHVETFDHCAEIPEKQKPRKAKNRELTKWLAQGNGERIDKNGKFIFTDFGYKECYKDDFVDDTILIRKWCDKEWHEPTVDYMGIEV